MGNRLDRNRNQGTGNRNTFQHRTITNIIREESQNKVRTRKELETGVDYKYTGE